jgi:hypothetical protein
LSMSREMVPFMMIGGAVLRASQNDRFLGERSPHSGLLPGTLDLLILRTLVAGPRHCHSSAVNGADLDYEVAAQGRPMVLRSGTVVVC